MKHLIFAMDIIFSNGSKVLILGNEIYVNGCVIINYSKNWKAIFVTLKNCYILSDA